MYTAIAATARLIATSSTASVIAWRCSPSFTMRSRSAVDVVPVLLVARGPDLERRLLGAQQLDALRVVERAAQPVAILGELGEPA